MAMQTAIARQNRRGVWLYNQLLCRNSDILSSETKTPLRGGISIQGPTVWAVPGSPHFYTIHGCDSLSSATDGNPHTQLTWRLAHSGPIAGGFDIAQDPPPQPLRLPGAQGQLCQEHTVTRPASFIPGHSYQLRTDDSNCLSRASPNNSVPHGFLQGRYRPFAQSFPENPGPYGSGFAGTSVGFASHATHPVLSQAEGSILGLASWWIWPVCISPGPLEGPPRRDLRHGAQKKGCHDRRFQQGFIYLIYITCLVNCLFTTPAELLMVQLALA